MASQTLNEASSGTGTFASTVATNLQTAVQANPSADVTITTIPSNAVTAATATATGSSGETLSSNVVSSSLQLSVTSDNPSALAADATFSDNLQTSIGATLGVDPSTVAITSVTTDSSGNMQVQYEVIYSDASAAAAASQTLNEAASGTGVFASTVATNLQSAV